MSSSQLLMRPIQKQRKPSFNQSMAFRRALPPLGVPPAKNWRSTGGSKHVAGQAIKHGWDVE